MLFRPTKMASNSALGEMFQHLINLAHWLRELKRATFLTNPHMTEAQLELTPVAQVLYQVVNMIDRFGWLLADNLARGTNPLPCPDFILLLDPKGVLPQDRFFPSLPPK